MPKVMPKKVGGFTTGYLKRELKEKEPSKMSPAQKAKEAKESPSHERREHKAASALQRMLKHRGK